jgi:Tfp pilus assembly protein PilE
MKTRFPLVELVVAIAIVGILMMLLIPAVVRNGNFVTVQQMSNALKSGKHLSSEEEKQFDESITNIRTYNNREAVEQLDSFMLGLTKTGGHWEYEIVKQREEVAKTPLTAEVVPASSTDCLFTYSKQFIICEHKSVIITDTKTNKRFLFIDDIIDRPGATSVSRSCTVVKLDE